MDSDKQYDEFIMTIMALAILDDQDSLRRYLGQQNADMLFRLAKAGAVITKTALLLARRKAVNTV